MTESGAGTKKDFFISYNKADLAWAEWIAWHLEADGYSVVIQAWDFGPACNFILEMDGAVQECDRIIAVLSPDYLASLFTQPEWAAYFAQDPTSAQRKIVPIRVRECELKGLLAPIVYTGLVGLPEPAAQAALLAAVKIGRRKPTTAPAFPGRKIIAPPRFPGALPEIWNVPHLRNPNFTEPGQRISEMRTALLSGQPAAFTQAVTGLGGLGKTQLAMEYCHRHASDYALVWWLHSEQPATLAAEYAALATALGLPEKDAAEQPTIIAAVRTALRQRQDWLLIFDNANTPQEIRPYLPGSRGHVLITSRNPAWSGLAQAVPVQKWPRELAVEFLLKRTGQTDEATSRDLAHELDDLPLALEQAAAYMEAAQKPLASYLTLFRQHHLGLLERGQPGTDYPYTVATTWEIAFQRLEQESPGGAALLQLCAFFAPDDIPREMIVAGAEFLPDHLRETVSDELALDDAVLAIRRYSLMEIGEDSALSMHRLVQAVIRDRLNESDQKKWSQATVTLIADAFPYELHKPQKWKEAGRLLPHADATSAFAEKLEVGMPEVAYLANSTGCFSEERGDYDTAKISFLRALRIGEKTFGSDHAVNAPFLSNLGNVLRLFGDLPEAQSACQRALEITEATYGLNDAKVAPYLSNLGNVMRAKGNLKEARAAFERALTIDKERFGPEHPEVAVDLNSLSNVLRALGDLSGAKATGEEALRIDENEYGPDHPAVASDLNNLACILQVLGNFQEAQALYGRAAEIAERNYGPDHPTVATFVQNLGSALRATGDFESARKCFERALIILRNSLGINHPSTEITQRNLNSVFRE